MGSAIGLSFGYYLRTLSLGGLLALLVFLPLVPRLMPEVRGARRARNPIQDPGIEGDLKASDFTPRLMTAGTVATLAPQGYSGTRLGIPRGTSVALSRPSRSR